MHQRKKFKIILLTGNKINFGKIKVAIENAIETNSLVT